MLTPPTPKIRVTVPVSPEVLERFKRLSQVAGQSVGRAMGEWLEETQVGLDPMIEILERHKKAPLKAIQTLQAYAVTLQDTTADLFAKVSVMDQGNEQMALAVSSAKTTQKAIGNAMKGATARGGPGLGGASRRRSIQTLTPPSSNTGGKVRKTTSKSVRGSK